MSMPSFQNKILAVVTMHQKERAIAPAMAQLGFRVVVQLASTDELGTFAGDVERKLNVRETLEAKVGLVRKVSNADFFIASEGSFESHAFLPQQITGVETLLFQDRDRTRSILVQAQSQDVFFRQLELTREQSGLEKLAKTLEQFQLATHGAILVARGLSALGSRSSIETSFQGRETSHLPVVGVVKDIGSQEELFKAAHELFERIDRELPDQKVKVFLETDLRAHRNPTRMDQIKKVAEVLAQRLETLCTKCSAYGFGNQTFRVGLPCEECKKPTSWTKEIEFSCDVCDFVQTQPRPDGLRFAPSDVCDSCNR